MIKHGISLEQLSVTETYHSNIKRRAVNSFIRTLPNDAWVVYPDLDEFFEYPCSVLENLDRQIDFQGIMMDRIGPGFTLPSITTTPSIEEQFPLSCPGLRNKMPGNPWDFKIILFKAFRNDKPREFQNSHQV